MANDIEAGLQAMLGRMKAKHEAEHGAGSFEHMQRKGRLIMSKRADELTPEEAAFLAAPPPAKQQ